ncbi:ATP-dependent DNA helicase RecG [Candidatus Bipolaricaulota bacterium]|nr:ATP-dependent DNA helicase RecG [Candidatus Bipolaricaulota bacterium]
MRQDNGDSMKLFRKILSLEQRLGYTDKAVIHGLETFVRQLDPQRAELVAGYADATHFDRQRAIERLLESIDDERTIEPNADDSIRPNDLPPPRPTRCSSSPGSGSARLDDLVAQAPGVGGKRSELLARLGIRTIEDLLLYLPRRLEDRTRFETIGRLRPKDEVCVRAEVLGVDRFRTGRRSDAIKVSLGDGTGFLYGVWFNQPWIAQQLKPGETIDLYGRIERHYGELQVQSPIWEPAGDKQETGRIVPIYPLTDGLTAKQLRSILQRCLDRYAPLLTEVVPEEIRVRHGFIGRSEAVVALHRPDSTESFEIARRSLAFEELLLLQAALRTKPRELKGTPHANGNQLATSLLASLPFTLTAGQRTAVEEIVRDLRSNRRMLRLLQGDVGAGKTLVAVTASLYAIEAGYQVAFMAPTEVLAEQHFRTIGRLLERLPVRIELLVGGRANSETHTLLANGSIHLVIGTHALIQEAVQFSQLGLVIIDEQHRFGVVQRSAIEDKGKLVDLLVMSATPIPRTIALTLYGEFDQSLIPEMPCGPKNTRTMWVGKSHRDEVYGKIDTLLREKSQGFVIVPMIEESEKLDLKAAVSVAEELAQRFPFANVSLIHGRMSAEDRNAAMDRFRFGTCQLLVATTVIEVGIDVPSASFMVIEHAERFGLSQLHQLRGRIGRAGQDAVCYAIADAATEEAQRRLEAFSTHLDGFALAEQDVQIRGPGDLLGTKQHGFLSQLRAADLLRDRELLDVAREEMSGLEEWPSLLEAAERRFGETLRWLQI